MSASGGAGLKVLYLHQHFSTPAGATGTRSTTRSTAARKPAAKRTTGARSTTVRKTAVKRSTGTAAKRNVDQCV